MLTVCFCIKSCRTYRPSEDNCSRMKVDFHNVALGNDQHTRHLSLGQHLIDKVIPGDVPTAGVYGVQQVHDDRYDEEGPQSLPVHLVLLLATLLLL